MNRSTLHSPHGGLRARRVRMAASLISLVVLTALAPFLAACTVSTTIVPSAAITGATTPLPQAVEAYMADLPGPSPKLFLTSRVYDRNGTLLSEFWDEGRRYWVNLERISPAVRQATIATEDKNFYTNPGVDWGAIVRAVLQNAGEGDVVSGASTITQQLARNITMTFERRMDQSLDRKMSETMLAQDLTARFSKDQILEMYLNVVNYGHLAYGIEAASRTFFGKSAADLTLAESTMLAALPQSPGYLDPLIKDNQERAKERQGIVLALMARAGYISQAEAQAAYEEALHYASQEPAKVLAPHFVQYVREYLNARYGTDLVNRGGLTIMTTLDLGLQQKAESIVKAQVASVRARYNLSSAALVALKPHSGEILAMVGSADYNDAKIDGQVNVATSLRQPGSAIKPVLYSLAFSRGLSPADFIADAPISYRLSNGQVYSPVNYDGRFHGTVRLRTALANSYNVPAVKLLAQMGVPDMVAMAHALGIHSLNKSPENYGLALTLGGSEVTLLDLTGVYAALANGGAPVPPTPIASLTDATGHSILQFGPEVKQAIDPRVAYMVTSVLSDNEARTPAFGANNPLKLSRPVAAKTGTTTDWRDNWTLGYTPYVAVGVWAGNSSGQPMRNTTGLTGAAPIWHDVMEAIFADPALDKVVRPNGEPLEFQRPPGLLDVPLCGNATCPANRTDLFIDSTQPITLGLTILPPPVVGDGTPTPAPKKGPGEAAAVDASKPIDPPVIAANVIAYAPNRFCLATTGGTTIPIVQLPGDGPERQRALQWASQVGVPVATTPCTGQTPYQPVAASRSDVAASASAPTTSSARIYSPAPGSVVSGPIDIVGLAVFSRENVQFYKVEFGQGSSPSDWVTMGSGHQNPVSDGVLETWHADAVPNGVYTLRVVLVKPDGNYVTSVPVMVEVAN